MTLSEWLSIGGAAMSPSLAFLQLRRVFLVVDVDLDRLVARLGEAGEAGEAGTPTDEPDEVRVRRGLLEGVSAESRSEWVRGLSLALSEPDVELQTMGCNEALGDIEGALSARASMPSVALRVAVFVALFSIAIVVARQEATPEVLANVVALGAGSVMAVLHLRRKITAVEKLTRRTIDRWVQAFAAQGSNVADEEGSTALGSSVLSRPRQARRVHSARSQSRDPSRTGRGSRR